MLKTFLGTKVLFREMLAGVATTAMTAAGGVALAGALSTAPQAHGIVQAGVMAAKPALHLAAATKGTTATALAGRTVAAYEFDSTDVDGTFDDGSGAGHTLKAVTSKGAVVRTMVHGSGRAVVFPDPCVGTACPRMVLQTRSVAALNPGSRDIRFGASVLLTARQTTDGQNVLQKGYSSAGGQYKLQVDKLPGKPSCAMTDYRSIIHLAKSSVSVADGAWHRLECRRSGTRLSIIVDGAVRGHTAVPSGLSVLNRAPLSIGGKGLTDNADQFQGALDDAWVAVG